LLIHLAFILFPQLGDNALEKIALEYSEDEEADEEPEEDPEMTVMMNKDEDTVMEENEDSDIEMLDGPPPGFTATKKKKTLKVKEKLDDEFLRRSKRVSQKLGGFKNEESAKKHKEEEKGNKTPKEAQKYKKTKAPKKGKKLEVGDNVLEEEPTPLAVIPPEGAPHLPKHVLEGIGGGFLQIQPSVVSAALLDNDDLDE